MYKRLGKKAFTLVELIISITILAIAAAAIYSVFANGIFAWRRGNQNKTFARTLRISSEKIGSNLRNTFKFTDIPFLGDRDFMMFPALIATELKEMKEEGELYRQVGRITYYFDKNKKALSKEVKTYPEVAGYSDKKKYGKGEPVIEKVKKLEFEYCYLDNATGDYKWKDDWKEEDQDSIPQAVKIKITFERNLKHKEFEKIVFIPAGTGEQKKELGKVEIDLGK